MLLVFYAGELVWYERDARIAKITGAAPVRIGAVPWASVRARALLVTWMLVLAVVGWPRAIIGGRLRTSACTGRAARLAADEYLLFALLALVIHTVVRPQHIGTLAALSAYAVIAFAPFLGIERGCWFRASPSGPTRNAPGSVLTGTLGVVKSYGLRGACCSP